MSLNIHAYYCPDDRKPSVFKKYWPHQRFSYMHFYPFHSLLFMKYMQNQEKGSQQSFIWFTLFHSTRDVYIYIYIYFFFFHASGQWYVIIW